jgi:hypothetical protein
LHEHRNGRLIAPADVLRHQLRIGHFHAVAHQECPAQILDNAVQLSGRHEASQWALLASNFLLPARFELIPVFSERRPILSSNCPGSVGLPEEIRAFLALRRHKELHKELPEIVEKQAKTVGTMETTKNYKLNDEMELRRW